LLERAVLLAGFQVKELEAGVGGGGGRGGRGGEEERRRGGGNSIAY